jgi:D-aminopeptidase
MFREITFLALIVLFTPALAISEDDVPMPEHPHHRPRLRDLGLTIGILPTGPNNSLTDVDGIQVGHRTIVEGDSIRTGVTAIKPHAGNMFLQKSPCAIHVANGFGKFVGSTQIEELGVLETPILLTNTLSTFAAADALVGWVLAQPGCESVRSVNPVVGECNDGYLNDIRSRRVSAEDVNAALENANAEPVAEGCVGAGTGTRCLGWKGGIGSSSRKLPEKLGGYTVGVLVQTNFGGTLTVAGVPVGKELGRAYLQDEIPAQEHGSCIVIVATDAPLDARQLKRLARRAPLGLAATGSPITHGSGDYVLAFSTAEGLRTDYESETPLERQEMLRDDRLSPLFQAVRDATEEAVLNSLLQAETSTGNAERTVEAINPDDVVKVCRQYRVLQSADAPAQSSSGTPELRSEVRNYGRAELSDSLNSRIAKLEDEVGPLMKEHHVPGVAVTVIADRQLVWSRGYGVRCAGSDQPVQPETVMEACSMSKPFFAYLFLKLVEEEKFDLDRPLVEYLGGDYFSDDPRHRQITARMALSHTTGLPNWREGGWRSDSPLSLEFDPGTKFRYSGEGFLMLQRALEKELDTDLDSISRERLIEPLKLAHTRFVWDDRFVVASACGHDREGHVKSERRYYDRANAGYTLYTSAEDYARFLVEIMKAPRSTPHSISAAMRKVMLTAISHRDDQDADWGLGWGLRELDGEQQVFHSGANGSGFRCYSEFFPASGDGLVIMTNALDGDDLWEALVEQWHATRTVESSDSRQER